MHQGNYLRIQELRQTTESLDEMLRDTIKLLADTRKEILSIPSSGGSDEPRRELKVDELLSYAKYISKTTVPPTFRKQDVPLPAVKTELARAQIANGIATPASRAQEDEHVPYSNPDNVSAKAMKNEDKRWLNPLEALPFEPWPSHDVIQRGALADIQRMIEAGRDPGEVLTAEEQAEADRRKREEEEREKAAQAERERRRMSMFDTGGVRRRETMGDVFNPDDL